MSGLPNSISLPGLLSPRAVFLSCPAVEFVHHCPQKAMAACEYRSISGHRVIRAPRLRPFNAKRRIYSQSFNRPRAPVLRPSVLYSALPYEIRLLSARTPNPPGHSDYIALLPQLIFESPEKSMACCLAWVLSKESGYIKLVASDVAASRSRAPYHLLSSEEVPCAILWLGCDASGLRQRLGDLWSALGKSR